MLGGSCIMELSQWLWGRCIKPGVIVISKERGFGRFMLATVGCNKAGQNMDKNGLLTKALAIIGTVLVWLPLLAPLFFGLFFWRTDGIFRFDYLMPAELSLLVLAGGGLLIWAAFRAHAHLALIAWSLGIAAAALVSSQLLAVVTGLASGETAVGGWQWALVLALLIIYTAAVAAIGVGGVLLLRDLFKPAQLHISS